MKNYLKKRIEELEACDMLPPLKSRAIKECKIHLRAWERLNLEKDINKKPDVESGLNFGIPPVIGAIKPIKSAVQAAKDLEATFSIIDNITAAARMKDFQKQVIELGKSKPNYASHATDEEKFRKDFEEAKKKLAEKREQNKKPVIFTNSKGDEFREGEEVWYKSSFGRVLNANINDIHKDNFGENKQYSEIFKTKEEAKAFSFETKMKHVNKDFVKINGVVVFVLNGIFEVGKHCSIYNNNKPIGVVKTIEDPSDEEIIKFKNEQQLDGYIFNEEKRIFEELKLEEVYCISESNQDYLDIYNAKPEIVDECANFDPAFKYIVLAENKIRNVSIFHISDNRKEVNKHTFINLTKALE